MGGGHPRATIGGGTIAAMFSRASALVPSAMGLGISCVWHRPVPTLVQLVRARVDWLAEPASRTPCCRHPCTGVFHGWRGCANLGRFPHSLRAIQAHTCFVQNVPMRIDLPIGSAGIYSHAAFAFFLVSLRHQSDSAPHGIPMDVGTCGIVVTL